MKTTIRNLTLTVGLLLSGSAGAHESATKGPNGGQLLDAPGGHWELVAKGGELSLYVIDAAEKPVATKAAKGTATVLVGGKTIAVELAPAEPNMLQGKGDFVSEKGMKVIISVQNLGDKPGTVRFTPLE